MVETTGQPALKPQTRRPPREAPGMRPPGEDTLAAANIRLSAAHADAEEARATLRDAIESLSDGFVLFDADDRLVLSNSAFLTMFPYLSELTEGAPSFAQIATRLSQIGATLGARIAPERWLEERLALHRCAQGTHVQALADGRWIQISELRTGSGGTVGIYTDITSVKTRDARRRAQDLAARNGALQATLDTLSEAVLQFDGDGRLQAWNEISPALLGLNREEMGLKLDDHRALIAWCVDTLALDTPAALEWRSSGEKASATCRMNGRHVIVRSVLLASGGMVFTFEDVTDSLELQRSLAHTADLLERRVAERTAQLVEVNRLLVAAKEEAERANRSKTRFLAAASHDLLQPLNAARLFVSALGEQDLAERPAALSRQACAALDSVEDMLEALFEISRLDAGAIHPQVLALPLVPILTALRSEFAPVAQSAALELEVAETDLWVRSDPRLLRRVLQNLLSNAIRYTAAGKVSITLTPLGDHAVTITVRDTGPGIAVADRDAIFEEFRRLDSARAIPGKGLGLSIVRRITTMMDMKLALDSTPGSGAAFSIELPLAPPEALPEDHHTPAGDTRQKGGLVLVIDNEPAILAGMEALLENWGLEVVTAHGPLDPEAADALARDPVLLIVDYHLDAGLTGDSAVAMLRAQSGRAIPAVIITADRAEETKRRMAELSLPMLQKPLRPARLRALLRSSGIV